MNLYVYLYRKVEHIEFRVILDEYLRVIVRQTSSTSDTKASDSAPVDNVAVSLNPFGVLFAIIASV